ncbi:hypothetical protein [Arthrobacter sp. NEB 688]|uniref:hypothetical protein n=1 Tax=Arthrobacter sp. NEB 688 TaxID=904039 RepID=UPI0015657F75|nr:hypothetical protein [Arthrobacter sp. NEB 688]QKE82741.1 hypothetical protein HL663_01420 [Arthrobacter sp. NEB 688]
MSTSSGRRVTTGSVVVAALAVAFAAVAGYGLFWMGLGLLFALGTQLFVSVLGVVAVVVAAGVAVVRQRATARRTDERL